jgi:hypothetical protein
MRSMLGLSLTALLTIVSFSTIAQARPPRFHAPNCPFITRSQGLGRVLPRAWYLPPSEVEFYGGYRVFTELNFFDDFSVVDNTTNYPSPIKGVKFPAPGNYARSRLQFADIHSWVIPQVAAIFGNITRDFDFPGGALRTDPNNCLISRTSFRQLATLQKAYG